MEDINGKEKEDSLVVSASRKQNDHPQYGDSTDIMLFLLLQLVKKNSIGYDYYLTKMIENIETTHLVKYSPVLWHLCLIKPHNSAVKARMIDLAAAHRKVRLTLALSAEFCMNRERKTVMLVSDLLLKILSKKKPCEFVASKIPSIDFFLLTLVHQIVSVANSEMAEYMGGLVEVEQFSSASRDFDRTAAVGVQTVEKTGMHKFNNVNAAILGNKIVFCNGLSVTRNSDSDAVLNTLFFMKNMLTLVEELVEIPPPLRKQCLLIALCNMNIKLPLNLFLPIKGSFELVQLTEILTEHSRVLDSAEKTPVLLSVGYTAGGTVQNVSYIVKNGADVPNEYLAYMIVSEIIAVWQRENLFKNMKISGIWLVGHNGTFIEKLVDVQTVDEIKKQFSTPEKVHTLKEHYENTFKGDEYACAVSRFIETLAGYSVISHLLALKDRHNANILIDNRGAIYHIDYGYIFGMHPMIHLEKYSFKITAEYIELMGGTDSIGFRRFRHLFFHGMFVLRKNVARFAAMLDVLSSKGEMSRGFSPPAKRQFVDRLMVSMSAAELEHYTARLIDENISQNASGMYDMIQYYLNNYYK